MTNDQKKNINNSINLIDEILNKTSVANKYST